MTAVKYYVLARVLAPYIGHSRKRPCSIRSDIYDEFLTSICRYCLRCRPEYEIWTEKAVVEKLYKTDKEILAAGNHFHFQIVQQYLRSRWFKKHQDSWKILRGKETFLAFLSVVK